MSFLTVLQENLTGWFNLERWFGVTASFEDGFVTGIAVFLACMLLIWLVYRCFGRSVRCKGLSVAGENGDLFITLTAVEEFVRRIMYEFEEASLRNIGMRTHKQLLVLDVEVGVVPGTDLVPLRDVLQRRIIADASQKLGLDRPVRVNIRVRSMEANQDKIAKETRKAGYDRSSSSPPYTEEPDQQP
ncbi:MAG: hypothetical protein K9N51_04935 [Candidatus Pacebacteria bacterium]|nr:hypothetical protein [Candidatus Paceibacterota bacterium]